MILTRVAFVLAATTAIVFSPSAFAQSGGEVITSGGVLPAAVSAGLDPADRLASSLRLLSQNPYDVTALTQAGESALAVGDANAAISFLARAEELNPGSGRIKSSLASALVLVERPTEAFRLFREAVALGVPEHQVAKDRGLAYDLAGDFKRAQKDYTVSLRHGNDEEVSRRLALSLGIAGEKDNALKVLDPLIRRNDQAAWRARAFVLAMNGDMKAAEKIAEQTSSGGTLASMSQFMRRLATLTPSQRAFAVNFGSMPVTDTRTAMAQVTDPFRPIGDGSASLLTPVEDQSVAAPVAVPTSSQRQNKAERRRPGRDDRASAVALAAPPALPQSQVKPDLVAAVPPPTPSWTTQRVSRRIGTRIGPVDPNSIPDVLKPAAVVERSALPGSVANRPPQFVPTDLKSLPPPSGSSVAIIRVPPAPLSAPPAAPAVALAVVPVVVLPASAAVTAVILAEPAPALFEVPGAAPQVVAVNETTAPTPPIAPAATAVPPALLAPVQVAVVTALPAAPGFSDAVMPATVAAVADAAPLIGGAAVQPVPVAPSAVQTPVQIVQPIPPAPEGLVSVLASIELEAESSGGPVMSDAQFRKARLSAKRKAEADDAKLLETESASKLKLKEDEDKRRVTAANPARIWVQVATGANDAGLSRTLSRIREQAPAALKGIGGASVPFKSTNRVLVGPFKSASEARVVVGKLTKAGVSATTFGSAAGQEVNKLPSR